MKAASLVKFSSRTKSCTPTRSRAVKALSMVTRTPSLPRACRGNQPQEAVRVCRLKSCLLPRLQDVEGRGTLDTGYRTCSDIWLGHRMLECRKETLWDIWTMHTAHRNTRGPADTERLHGIQGGGVLSGGRWIMTRSS